MKVHVKLVAFPFCSITFLFELVASIETFGVTSVIDIIMLYLV